MGSILGDNAQPSYRQPIGHRHRVQAIRKSTEREFIEARDFRPDASMDKGSDAELSKRALRYGEARTISDLDAIVADLQDQIDGLEESIAALAAGEWTSYSPTWTAKSGSAPSVGNGTLAGGYIRTGNLVIATVKLTLGSTTARTGVGWLFSLPIDGVVLTGVPSLGSAFAKKYHVSSPLCSGGFPRFDSTDLGQFWVVDHNAFYGEWGESSPFGLGNWTDNSYLEMMLVYPVAPA